MIQNFDYWGNHAFDTDTNTLIWRRHCGIFPNVMVLMHCLMDLRLKNIIPQKIKTELTEYNNFNLYEGVFEINERKLEEWKNFNIHQIRNMRHNTSPNLYGFGMSQNQIDLQVTSLLIDTYFNFTNEVKNKTFQFKDKFKINSEDSAFIWWRKTDKIHEITWFKPTSKYPEINNVLKFLKPYKNVYMQTDDPNVFSEFSKIKNINCLDVFNRNKFFVDRDVFKNGFHIDHKDTSDEMFRNKYGMTRKDYIVGLASLVDIASKSSQFIGYPGNISLFVSLVRKNFNNVVMFKDHEELF